MMAYDKKKLYQQAVDAITKNKLIFVEEVVAYLPCVKSVFYSYFPPDSNESNELKELIEINKISIKKDLRDKWAVGENATLQLALYKLSSSEEELKKLAMEYKQHSGNMTINIPPIKWMNGSSDK